MLHNARGDEKIYIVIYFRKYLYMIVNVRVTGIIDV
jgi:hypothetical protein